MTVPANFNTPDRIIRMGLKDAGLLQEGDDPSPEQFADGMNRLNDLINFWQTQGIKVWLQSDLTVPLVEGKGTYTLGPTGDVVITKPTRVLDEGAFVLDYFSRPGTSLSETDRMLRHLEALLIVCDTTATFVLSGTGDVIEPDDGIVAIGSGGSYALASARALMENTELSAREIAEKSLKIAGQICIYTNDQLTIEELKKS